MKKIESLTEKKFWEEESVKKYDFPNRKIKKEIIVKNDGDFASIDEARKIAKADGYDIGTMCGDLPMALAPTGKFNYIAKWKNIPRSDYSKIDGVLLGERADGIMGFREGAVKIIYFE